MVHGQFAQGAISFPEMIKPHDWKLPKGTLLDAGPFTLLAAAAKF